MTIESVAILNLNFAFPSDREILNMSTGTTAEEWSISS